MGTYETLRSIIFLALTLGSHKREINDTFQLFLNFLYCMRIRRSTSETTQFVSVWLSQVDKVPFYAVLGLVQKVCFTNSVLFPGRSPKLNSSVAHLCFQKFHECGSNISAVYSNTAGISHANKIFFFFRQA